MPTRHRWVNPVVVVAAALLLLDARLWLRYKGEHAYYLQAADRASSRLTPPRIVESLTAYAPTGERLLEKPLPGVTFYAVRALGRDTARADLDAWEAAAAAVDDPAIAFLACCTGTCLEPAKSGRVIVISQLGYYFARAVVTAARKGQFLIYDGSSTAVNSPAIETAGQVAAELRKLGTSR